MKTVRRRVPQLERWREIAACRSYSVRVPRDRHNQVKSVADLKAWNTTQPEPDVEVCGWVRSVRKSSRVRFVDITDGSSIRPIQAVVGKELAADLRPGAAVRLKGSWHNDAGHDGMTKSISGPQVSDLGSGAGQSILANQMPSQLMSRGASGDDSLPLGHRATTPAGDVSTKVQSQPKPAATISELQVHEAEVLGPSDPQTNPIQNKYQTPESLRNMPHLRSRMPLNSALLRMRSDAVALLTQFFFARQFQQSHPPIITSSDCEGAGEAFSVRAGDSEDFFGLPKYLTVSSQLHLEALSQALGNVWALSPTFRAEQSDTSRHLSEFYMLEAEMTFVDELDTVMDLVQDMLSSLAHRLKQLRAAQELETNRQDARDPAEKQAFEDLKGEQELRRRWGGLLSRETWPRITYSEAVQLLQAADVQFTHKPTWGAGLQSEHERYLAEKIGWDRQKDVYKPVFITQYPRDIKAFYMRQSASDTPEQRTVDCFDLLVPGVGELAGGSMREHRLDELTENMKLHGLEVPMDDNAESNTMNWYLDLRRWGCPPHGGFGLGFDRLLGYLTGVASVRDVVPFPRYFGRSDC